MRTYSILCIDVLVSINSSDSSTAYVYIRSLQSGWRRAQTGCCGEASLSTINPGDQDGGKHVCNPLHSGYALHLL